MTEVAYHENECEGATVTERTASAADWCAVTTLKTQFLAGLSFDEFVFAAKENADLLAGMRARATAPPEYAARVAATARRWRLLVMTEDWCGDGVSIVPWVDALAASSPDMDLRVIRRDEHLDLMDAHLTNGHARAVPVVLLLDESYVERAWWGPRPAALQRWFMTDAAQSMEKPARFKELRRFYARDRGRSILEEITAMVVRVAVQLDEPPATLRAAV